MCDSWRSDGIIPCPAPSALPPPAQGHSARALAATARARPPRSAKGPGPGRSEALGAPGVGCSQVHSQPQPRFYGGASCGAIALWFIVLAI